MEQNGGYQYRPLQAKLSCLVGYFWAGIGLIEQAIDFSLFAVFARAAACEHAFQGHRLAFFDDARAGEWLPRERFHKETIRRKNGRFELHNFGAVSCSGSRDARMRVYAVHGFSVLGLPIFRGDENLVDPWGIVGL